MSTSSSTTRSSGDLPADGALRSRSRAVASAGGTKRAPHAARWARRVSGPEPLRRAGAHRIVSQAVRTAVLDSLILSAPEDACVADWQSIRDFLRRPVEEATQAALSTLEVELQVALDRAPEALLARLDELHVRAQLGCD